MNDMTPVKTSTPKDWETDQEVRWCPGCGDYSILAQMKKVLGADVTAELERLTRSQHAMVMQIHRERCCCTSRRWIFAWRIVSKKARSYRDGSVAARRSQKRKRQDAQLSAERFFRHDDIAIAGA